MSLLNHRGARFALLAILCFAAMLFDFGSGAAGESHLLLAPEAGIALGGLIVFGWGLWPAIWLAATVATLLMDPETPVWGQAMMGFGEAVSALAGALLLGWLERDRRARRWIALAAAATVTVLLDTGNEALVNLLSGAAPGWDADGSWADAVAREALGMGVALPLILTWARPYREAWTPARLLHLAAMAGATALLASQIAFGDNTGAIAWTTFLVLAWSALAFQRHGATLAMFLLSVLATAGTAFGHGPFDMLGPRSGVILGQASIAAMMAVIYTLAARIDAQHEGRRLREAEALASEREARLMLFLDNAPTAIAIFDRDLNYIGSSRRYLADFDLPPETPLAGRAHFDLFPHLVDRWQPRFERALQGEHLSDDEEAFDHLDGRTDLIRWQLRPWLDGDKAVAGVILFSEVITEAVEAMRQIEAAEARYRAMFEQAAMGVVIFTPDGRYLEVNDYACRIFGRDREALIGRSFATFTHPDDLESDSAAALAMLKGEFDAYSVEKRVKRGDGALVWMAAAVRLVRNPKGEPAYFLAMLRDITARRHAEAALAESEARLRLAQYAANVGVWELDIDRGIVTHSPVGLKILCLPEDSDGVFTFDQLAPHFSPEVSERVREKVTHAVETRGPYDITFTLTTPEGKRRWIHSRGHHDPGRGPIGRILGVTTDETDFHEAREKLIEAHEKLLRVSRLSAMGAMASTLAHELNQPLAASANYAQACRQLITMRGNPDDGALIEMLDNCAAQTLRAGDIIRKMRRFTATGEITQQAEDIEAVIASAASSERDRPKLRGVTIEMVIDPAVGLVMIDRVQIEQVLANLIRNAAEAMQDSPEKRITVVAEPGRGEVLVSVIDTGPGLSPEHLDNLFEPFRSSKANGMGLGLPICRTIVEAHGGRMWVESKEGEGARFHLALLAARPA